ncbi:Putative ribonuclease H protein At1g65750 [Linum perenne]
MAAPPKMKHLLWHFLRGIIPTRAALNQRGMDMTMACGCCNGGEESLEHLFFQCPIADRYWEVAELRGEVEVAMMAGGEAADWLTRLINNPDKRQVQNVAAVVWSLWRERNDRVWNQQSKHEELIVKQGQEQVQEWWELKQGVANVRTQAPINDRERHGNRWQQPDPGVIKINMDAALFFEEGRHDVGLVARDEHGNLLGYKQHLFLGTPPASKVEEKGLEEVLRWAATMNWTRVFYETDCQVVIQAAEKGGTNITEFGRKIEVCRSLLQSQPHAEVVFLSGEMVIVRLMLLQDKLLTRQIQS